MFYLFFLGDACPMHFDDGSNPWLETENIIQVFSFGYYSSSNNLIISQLTLTIALILVYIY